MTERTRHHRVRRIALRVVALLLLGAIVNVVAASLFSLVNQPVWSRTNQCIEFTPSGAYIGSRADSVGCTYIYVVNRLGTVTEPRVHGTALSDFQPYWFDIAETHLQFRAFEFLMSDQNPPFIDRATVATGWPMRAFLCDIGVIMSDDMQRINHVIKEGDRLLDFGIATSQSPLEVGVYSRWPRVVPLRPIWPGFAINTVFYATILWLLFAAPFTLRRWRRSKRGLCPKCAYPQGTSEVCTECGEEIYHRGTESTEGAKGDT